jgi:hypothetical protein
MAWMMENLDLPGDTNVPFFLSSYLNSPVLLTPRTQYLSAYHRLFHSETETEDAGFLAQGYKTLDSKTFQALSLSEKKAHNLHKEDQSSELFEILDPDEYPDILACLFPSSKGHNYREAATIAERIYRDSLSALSTWVSGADDTRAPQPKFDMSLSADELYYYDRWIFWDQFIGATQEMYRRSKQYAVRINSPTGYMITNGEIVRIRVHDKDGVLWKRTLTWEQALMIKDCLYSRAQSMTACRVIYPDLPKLPVHVRKLFTWHEMCIRRYSNIGFNLLKQSEALSKTYLSTIAGDEFGEDGPYARMKNKVRDKELDILQEKGWVCLPPDTRYLDDIFDELLKECTDIREVVEIFGLYRVSCHPLIDPIAGGASAAEQALSPDMTNPADADALNNNFKRMFLEAYILRKREWPPLVFQQNCQTKLRSLFTRQTLGIHRTSYPLSDWDTCEFGKIFDLDTAPNFLEFMDDKSISLYRTNVAASWNNNIPLKSNRRLLLEMLSRKEISVKDIMVLVIKREIPFDWLVVSLYPKERELKPDPRMFSMMVFEMRLFFSVIEANLADNVFPIMPQQTMTKDRLAVARMFMGLTRPSTDTDEIHMFLEVDLSRWNLRWRSLTVHKVGHSLDCMFGVRGIFTFVHEFFDSAMILVRVPNLPPDGIELDTPPSSSLLWYGHKGGFEGIAQKHWTLCTYSMVDLAISDFALSFILLGQGDNQILSVKAVRDHGITRRDQLVALRDRLTSSISQGCAKVNQIVKPEECVESTKVITYSKDIYVDGVYYPTALKFNSRLFPNSAQDFPSIRTNVGAIFSTALAGAEKSSHPLRGHYLACFHASHYLLQLIQGYGMYGSTIKKEVKVTSQESLFNFINFVLTLPSELGGYPVLPFTSFMYKSGSDPLSKSLASLILLSAAQHRLYNRMMAQLDMNKLYKENPDPASLIQDPYSIPLDKPVTSIDGVTRETMERISNPTVMVNEAVYQLVSADATQYTKELTDILVTARPFNPLVLRDIQECSVKGVVDTLGKMFVATRTLQTTARKTGGGIIPKIFELEYSGFRYLVDRFSTLPVDPWKPRRVFEMAMDLRARWTQGEIPAPEGITTHLPFDFKVSLGHEALTTDGIIAVLTTDHLSAITKRGPYDPYVGSKTQEKRSEHGYKIVGTDTTSISFRRLQMILAQSGGDKNFESLINHVGLTRSHTHLSDITDQLTGVHGGILTHRYAARAGYQEAYNVGSPNFATHCVVSTDKTGELTGGVNDYPVMFTEHILCALWTLQTLEEIGQPSVRSVCINLHTNNMTPIVNVTTVIPDVVDLPHISFEGNPLAFLSELDIRRISGFTKHHSIGSGKLLDKKNRLSQKDKILIAEGWFRDMLAKQGVSRIASDISSSLLALDTLDVMEVVGAGLENLFRAGCNVVCDELCMSTVRASISPHLSRDNRVMAHGLSEILCSTFSGHIGHPHLVNDPMIRKFRLYDGPRYYSTQSRPLNKLTSLMANESVRMIENDSPHYYLRSVCLFSSESVHGSFSVFLNTISRVLMLSYRLKGIRWNEIRIIMRNFILPIMRLDEDDSKKINALVFACRSIQPWLLSRFMYIPVDYLTRVIEGKIIIGLQVSSREATRMLRPLPEELQSIPPRTERNRLRMSRLPDNDIQCTATKENLVLCGSKVPVNIELKWKESVIARMARHCGARSMYGCSATSLWSQFGACFHNRTVIVIGSGQGAAAAGALLGGALHVYGLDKTDTIPPRPHRFAHYKPPAIVMQGTTQDYTQMAESYITSGDWFDESISSVVCSTYDPGDAAWVIDLESGGVRYGLELLNPLVKAFVQGPVLMRVFWTHDELEFYLTALQESQFKFRCYPISEPGRVRGYIVLISKFGDELRYYLPSHSYNASQSIFLISNASAVPMQEYFSDAIYNIMPIPENHKVVDVLYDIMYYRDRMQGIYESRLSYDRWTLIMRGIISVWWASRSAEERVNLLIEWRNTKTVVFSCGEHSFDLNYTDSLEYHLTGTVSRLCPFSDRQILLNLL